MMIKKPQILYAPMLSSFGGGSARGFNPGGGGGLGEFVLTLSNGTTYSQVYRSDGDTDAQISSFFGSNLSSDPGYISSSGTSLYKPYDGYYSMQLGINCIVTIRCKGASGGYPTNTGSSGGKTLGYGRDVEGTFALSANDILVFGVGKTGEDGDPGQSSAGAGGGATFCYKRVSTTDTILAVGAGGSATPNYESWIDESYTAGLTRLGNSAVPLSSKGTGNHNSIISSRSSKSGLYWYSSAYSGGVGRPSAGGSGGGFNNSGRSYDGSTNTNLGNGLLTTNPGFKGGVRQKRGGFGGGGGHDGGNNYAGGGGGYFGAFECAGTPSTHTAYAWYVQGDGEGYDNNLGPISYVENSASSFTDNGIYGSPSSSTSTSDSLQGGQIVFTFNPVP